VPSDATKPVPRASLDPDDARALLAELRRTPDGLRFGLSLLVGLRPGEAAALHWSDIADGVLSVNRSLQLDARGRPDIVDDLKVESARRSIEMPPEAVEWLHEHATDSRRPMMTLPAGESLVFAAANGAPFSPTTSRADLAAACERAGVRKTLPNELRHSCASLLIDQGVAIERVADLLGHNSTRMVDMVYRHRVRPTIDAALAPEWTVAK
jgi:integrase